MVDDDFDDFDDESSFVVMTEEKLEGKAKESIDKLKQFSFKKK